MDAKVEAFIAELQQKLQRAVESQNFALISFYAKLIEDTKRSYRLIDEIRSMINRNKR